MPVAPKRPKGPPLNALRAFEAAARYESFVMAAEELMVSPGAISQHVKSLEEWTGAALFVRTAKGVQLTPDGQQIAPDLIAAFDQLGQAVRGLQGLSARRELRIATLPAIAQLWLPAHLRIIRAQGLGCTVHVTALETPPNLDRNLFDLSIFLEPSESVPAQAVLWPDEIIAVCAPELAEGADWSALPRLVDESWSQDWSLWEEAHPSFSGQAGDVFRYSLYSLALEEAKAGAGVLLGHRGLIEHALQDGTLISLPYAPVPTGLVWSLRRAHGVGDPALDQVIAYLTGA